MSNEKNIENQDNPLEDDDFARLLDGDFSLGSDSGDDNPQEEQTSLLDVIKDTTKEDLDNPDLTDRDTEIPGELVDRDVKNQEDDLESSQVIRHIQRLRQETLDTDDDERSVDDDVRDILKQRASNRQMSVDTDLPGDYVLLDAPRNIPPRKYDDTPGDDDRMRSMFVIAIFLIVFLVGALIIAAYAMLSYEPEEREITSTGPMELGMGEVATGSPQPGQNNNGNYGASPNDEDGNVSYVVTTEGDIDGLSASFINGAGQPEDETGISTGWVKKVSLNTDEVSPKFAVSSTGSGTVICSIEIDGKEVEKQTSAGDSPTVRCEA